MGAFLKKNWVTVLIVLATVVLAGVAIYTAIRLYQLRQTTVAPNVPSSQPAANELGYDNKLCKTLKTQLDCEGHLCSWNVRHGTCHEGGNVCTIVFDIGEIASPSPSPSLSPSPSPSLSPSPSPSPSLSPSPTPTTPPACNTTCTVNADCGSGMTCTTSGQCRNTSCQDSANCICATVTPTPTATATPAPPLSCGDSCSTNADCANNMVCVSSGVCRNPSCLNATNCLCATSTPSGTRSPIAAAGTPAPQLPESGTSTPTLIGAAAGILLLLGAFILAL